MKYKNVAVGIIRNANGEILLTQRFDPDVPAAHLKWDLVGGKIENGETGDITVMRESLEETGCTVKVIKKLDKETSKIWETSQGPLTVTLSCYEGVLVKESSISPTDRKIGEIQWVSPNKLQDFELLETIEDFVADYL